MGQQECRQTIFQRLLKDFLIKDTYQFMGNIKSTLAYWKMALF